MSLATALASSGSASRGSFSSRVRRSAVWSSTLTTLASMWLPELPDGLDAAVACDHLPLLLGSGHGADDDVVKLEAPAEGLDQIGNVEACPPGIRPGAQATYRQ